MHYKTDVIACAPEGKQVPATGTCICKDNIKKQNFKENKIVSYGINLNYIKYVRRVAN
jgi:hypothetical protein